MPKRGRLCVLLVTLFLAATYAAQAQSVACGSFLESFDAPFGGIDCAGITGPTATCHSRYTHNLPYPGAWVDPATGSLPVPSVDVADSYFWVRPLPNLTTNWLVVKPYSAVNVYTQYPPMTPVTGTGQTFNPTDQYNTLWSKTLSLPAGYGGRFMVDVPGSPSQLAQQYRDIRCSLSGYNVAPQIVAVPGRPGESRLVFDLPDGPSAGGTTTLSLQAPQWTQATVTNYQVEGQSQPQTEWTLRVAPVPYYSLDNISFRSNEPDFVEPFDPLFVDCPLPANAPLSATCHSRYTHNLPYPGAWVDPATGSLPVPSVDVADSYFWVRPLPNLTTNWLVVKPYSAVNVYTQYPPMTPVTGTGQTFNPTDQYNTLWSKTLSLPAGYGGRFMVDVPGSPSQLAQQYRDIRCSLSGYNVAPQIVAVPGRPGESRLVFDLPDGPSAGGTTTLSLQAPQWTQATVTNYQVEGQSQPQTEWTLRVAPVPYYSLDNISFRSNGFSAPLFVPLVANVSICAPGGPTQLTVAPTEPGVAYAWYDSPSSTAPFATGTSITVNVDGTNAVNGAKTYYVQAVPAGALGCPSDYRAVTVTIQSVTLPTVSVPVSVVLGNTLTLRFTGQANYTYSWSWGDQTPATSVATPTTGSAALSVSHLYGPSPTGASATYPLVLTVRDNHQPAACEAVATYSLVVADKLCEVALPTAGLADLTVRLDQRTGSYSFLPGTACRPTPVVFDCLTGAGTAQEVVAASAVSFAEGPAPADATYGLDAAAIAANPFLAGAGHPHPQATYAYATPVNDTYTRSTERGRFAAVPFNWQVGAQHRVPAWQRAGLATRYSPDGQAVEEQDILGIASTVKLGYAGRALPYLTAKNAAFNDVLFEGFEKVVTASEPPSGEDNFIFDGQELVQVAAYAHSGRQSAQLLSSGSPGLSLPVRRLPAAGGLLALKYWVRVSTASSPGRALSRTTIMALAANPFRVRWTVGQTSSATVIAQTGEWVLCEAVMPAATAQALGSAAFAPRLEWAGPSGYTLWVDDLRLQPEQAQMTAYVYDPATLKLLASFDDQHFGLYYQYNAEGKLVRKQVETERGRQTVQETQYNSPKP